MKKPKRKNATDTPLRNNRARAKEIKELKQFIECNWDVVSYLSIIVAELSDRVLKIERKKGKK